ncbi:UDP-N-acetylmuramoyl-tripeptide--D-alanyl-D-alanine ligase [Humitalea rosea]|uniref:UDP-N-acetylmuramoyl-tripeptide--D-alanyl-D-alanine ligase n=1 Tax=Humitalea rosea TaxID=990373 RepID=A0A2W7IJR9_9PROT|nr:UDP-N-acetylmuramoyl-tripeptide--D-alanyl-D-alanine ligase [Humitalea rosea]PZW46888.1 UDP-N-acetylmuramoyl-tripeptide--D-alanyl-D-alanine ligase [Humitalea rosea]
MSALWTAAELRQATGGTGGADVTGVAIDSRAVVAGDLFVALRAERDGHAFVADALARGAACAMVAEDVPGLRVADTLVGLAALGAAGRARTSARVVAVTGSVGKTTVKEMLRHGLAGQGLTHASAASHNNQWGVPLTLARLPRAARYAVIEIGMNNRGEIAPLARLARPDVAVVTNIGTAHVGNLGSEAAIAAEKGDILLGLERGGIAVLPADSPHFAALAATAPGRVVGFGHAAGAQARLLEVREQAGSVEVSARLYGHHIAFTVGAPGAHMAMNAIAAIAAAAALGADPLGFAASLATFGAGAGRGQRVVLRLPGGGSALLLDESYNASVASVRAALSVLAAQEARRRIAVLGDMLELGEAGPAQHLCLLPDVVGVADLVFCCGPLMRRLFEALPAERRGQATADSTALAPLVAGVLRDGDAVMVKGSLGSRMAVVVAALKELAA